MTCTHDCRLCAYGEEIAVYAHNKRPSVYCRLLKYQVWYAKEEECDLFKVRENAQTKGGGEVYQKIDISVRGTLPS